MNRRPSSLRSLAIVATGDTATTTAAFVAMSFRPHYKGGRRQGSRGFCDRPLDSTSGEFVSGDSHCGAVQAANRGFRPSYNVVPPPLHYGAGREFYGPVSQPPRPGPHLSQQLPGPLPRPYRNAQQAGSSFDNYQPFIPQKMRPQFRPRPSKPPDYREWEYAKPGPPPNQELFTVLSYNILADYLARDHWQKLYFHIPGNIMDWNWRKRNICFELGLWSADILCFQEVDRFQDLEAELNPRGYYGIWKMRTGDPADGCAIFWRASRFKLVHEESIEYNKFGLRDNVAQICVFESLNELNNGTGASTPSTSSMCCNRVVVCNIHVLFNPKRGDIKLGQIRLLLERANAISKHWGDTPVVVCGDFNGTPKSPMYKFIREQKLDLSGLPRDEVSGQAQAEIRPSRHPYPDYRKATANQYISASEASCGTQEQGGFPLDGQKLASLNSSTDSSTVVRDSKSECSMVDETSEACIGEGCGGGRADDLPSPYSTGNFGKACQLNFVPLQSLDGSLTSAPNDAEPPDCPAAGTDGNASLETSCVHTKATEVGECVESNLNSLSMVPDNQIKHSPLPDNHSTHLVETSESKRAYDSDTSKLEESSEILSPDSLDMASSKHVDTGSAATVNLDKPSIESTSGESVSDDLMLSEKFEHLSLNESMDGARDDIREDREAFLAALHDTGASLFSDDLDSSSSNERSHSDTHLILNDPHHVEDVSVVDVRNSFSSASAWTPAEIQLATGSADCKVLEHPLKLKSAYAEVQSSLALRDSSGEPLVTSYHRKFSGTVDYIWCTEGLQTKKVLAPIPKEVMQQTQGFPTKKWGSDHIALVAQFAFTKDIPSENISQ